MDHTRSLSTKTILAQRDRQGAITEAAACIQEGGIVVLPTETVYGLAADAFNPAAIASIYKAKGRPQDNPLIVHISGPDMLHQVTARLTPVANKLIDAFWPGPLSLVLDKHADIPAEVSAGLSTVAVRMPDHKLMREIIRQAGTPLAAPSANISGRPSPTLAMHAYEDLCGRVPLIIDDGPTTKGVESTVVDARGDVPIILRPGDITAEQIAAVAGSVKLCKQTADAADAPASPGMKYRHYAPDATVLLFSGEAKHVAKNVLKVYDTYQAQSRNAVILCLDNHATYYEGRHTHTLGKDKDEVQAHLFSALREADAEGRAVILFHYDPAMGDAVLNRIQKAADQPIKQVE